MKSKVSLMNIPSHLIYEILTRLPAKSVFCCKCVCKTWHELISDPQFVAAHFSHAKPGLVVHHAEMFKNFLRLHDYKDDNDHNGLHYDTPMNFNLSPLNRYDDADIVVDGSIDGFLLLRDVNFKHETLYICNPVTREYIVLPEPKCIVRYPSVVTHGFGKTNAMSDQEYKVVRIFHERELHHITGACLRVPRSDCQVYTLGTGQWRDVGEVPYAYNSTSIGLFCKGNLHWLVDDLEGDEMISCFDLENESFRPLPPPFRGRKIQGSLGVLGDCLCLCDNTSYSEIDIWAMGDYGDEKSWIKLIAVEKMPRLSGPSLQVVYPLKVFRDGVVLLVWGDFFLMFYDSKSKSSEEVDMNQTRGPNSIEAMHHVSTFLPLKSFVMENVYTVPLRSWRP